MNRLPARSRILPPMRVKARSRVVSVRQGRREDAQRRFLTILGSIFLIVALVCLAVVLLLKMAPSWVLSEKDSVTVVVPAETDEPGVLRVVVSRPVHRGSLVITVPYDPAAPLISGLFPELPMKEWAAAGFTPSSSSQALGFAVDTTVQVPASVQSSKELLAYVRSQAWENVQSGQFTSSWVLLAASLQSARVIELDSLETLPTVLDRNDVALMGDFNSCQIAVMNATGRNGLASAVGQIIEQSGGQVIRLESATALTLDSLLEENDARIHLLVRPGKAEVCQSASSRILHMFTQAVPDENEAITTRLRADLVLILGNTVEAEGLFQQYTNFVTASEQYLQK